MPRSVYTMDPMAEQIHDLASKPMSIPNALESLRAEMEGRWLHQVFVEPSGFSRLLGDRSVVVLGDVGSGKTAVRLMLAHQVARRPDAPLVVHWQPGSATFRSLSGYSAVQQLEEDLRRILGEIALSLMMGLGQEPERHHRAPAWVQETVNEFIHTFVPRIQRQVARIGTDLPEEGRALLQQIAAQPIRQSEQEGPEIEVLEWVREIVDMALHLGWRGIWVLVDGLEAWLDLEIAQVEEMLRTLMSALNLFEIPNFSLKLFAPVRLKPLLAQSSGVVRRRFDLYSLTWTSEELRLLLERRLAGAFGRTDFSLKELCAASKWPAWLAEYGGGIPRGWLELARPVVDEYIRQGRTLSKAEWQATIRTYPPQLRIDLRQEKVFLGYKEIANVTPTAYRILHCLYTHHQRRCSREELVRHVFGEEAFNTDWRSQIDTAIWRLRKAIEPDSKKPIYVVTQRGRGIGLHHAW